MIDRVCASSNACLSTLNYNGSQSIVFSSIYRSFTSINCLFLFPNITTVLHSNNLQDMFAVDQKHSHTHRANKIVL